MSASSMPMRPPCRWHNVRLAWFKATQDPPGEQGTGPPSETARGRAGGRLMPMLVMPDMRRHGAAVAAGDDRPLDLPVVTAIRGRHRPTQLERQQDQQEDGEPAAAAS